MHHSLAWVLNLEHSNSMTTQVVLTWTDLICLVETEFAWALMQHDLSRVCCGMSPQFVRICAALTLTSHVFWTDHDDENYHGVVEDMSV